MVERKAAAAEVVLANEKVAPLEVLEPVRLVEVGLRLEGEGRMRGEGALMMVVEEGLDEPEEEEQMACACLVERGVSFLSEGADLS